MKSKIIFDTDPGIDDAFAILYALYHPNLEVVGITTVFGNVSVETASKNALILSEMSGKKAPVFQGAHKAIQREQEEFPTLIHGIDGFGNINLPPAKMQKENEEASEFIVKKINEFPNEISIIAVGPLTNLANAIQKDNSIQNKVKEVIIMGGSFREGGNISPVAEANIYNDPEAADIVFSASWNLTMVGLDVTHKVSLSSTQINQLPNKSRKCGEFLKKISKCYIDFYRSKGMDGCFFHDATSLIFHTNPDFFEYIEGKVCVSQDGLTRGQTVVLKNDLADKNGFWNGRNSIKVLIRVNPVKVIDNYLNIVESFMD